MLILPAHTAGRGARRHRSAMVAIGKVILSFQLIRLDFWVTLATGPLLPYCSQKENYTIS
eukprot:141025-Amorphochlora_amoeboformis.AAC.1